MSAGERNGFHAEILQRSRHFISAAHHVADSQVRGCFDVNAAQPVNRRPIEEIRTQAWIPGEFISLVVTASAVFGDCLNLISLLGKAAGRYLKCDR